MRFRTSFCGAIGALLLASVIACQQLDSSDARELDSTQNANASDTFLQGRALFDLHCAICHGSDGRGDGTAAPFLFPPSRDFALSFRLVTTDNDAPSEEDLVGTLKRGMPGSAMPSWDWLSEPQLQALATFVRELATLGLAEELASKSDEALNEMAAYEEARRRLSPGTKLNTPTQQGDVERGRALYMQSCAHCHEEDGSGSPVPLWTPSNELAWARDFTAGFMKGEASVEAIAARIQTGMPGSAMPSAKFGNPQDLADLVAFVRSLIAEGSDYRLVHRRQRIAVERVSAPLSLDPEHISWHAANEVLIALSPLWWQNESVVQVSVSALHDGENFAVRLRWNDAVGGPATFGNRPLPDAAAIQFSEHSSPPLFGMGSHNTPTTIWHWKSQSLVNSAGELDLLGHFKRSDANLYQALTSQTEHAGRVEQVDGQGIENVTRNEHPSGGVRVVANWHDGEWEVVFVRAFNPPGSGAFSPKPGSRIQMASSIWNGEAADVGGHKSISIWHELDFRP